MEPGKLRLIGPQRVSSEKEDGLLVAPQNKPEESQFGSHYERQGDMQTGS